MKIGIVLSGGGIRGIAHLGVLKALTDHGITFSHITGTSAGSIVGALFAQGIDPYEILNIFLKTKLSKFIRPSLGELGLLSIDKTENLFKEYLPHDNFNKLSIPLTIAATNFSEAKLVYFSKGPLIKAIQASSCIPGVFKPIMLDGKMYVDGGILNNFPIEPLIEEKCDFIIGSSCNHLMATEKITNIRKLVERAGIMTVNAVVEGKKHLCDAIIEPRGMGEISVFDVKRAEEIYWIAFEATLQEIQHNEKLQSILSKTKKP